MPNEYTDLIPEDATRAAPEPLVETTPFFLNDVNPDEVAAAVTAAKKFGVPERAVAQDPQWYELQERDRTAREYASTSLPIAQLLADPEKARQSSDSIGELSYFEKLWRSTKEGWQAGRNTVELADIGKSAWLSPTGYADDKVEARIEELLGFQRQDYFPNEEVPDFRYGQGPDFRPTMTWLKNFAHDMPGAAAEFAAQSFSTFGAGYLAGGAGAVGGGAAGALAGLGGGAPGVLSGAGAGARFGFGLGASIGSGYQMLKLEGINWFLQNRNLKSEDGTPIPMGVLRGISLGVAIPNMFLERFALGKIFGDLPGAKSMFGASAGRTIASRVIANPQLFSIFTRLGAGATESSITNGFQEGTQEFVQIMGDLLAKTYADAQTRIDLPKEEYDAFMEALAKRKEGDLDADILSPMLDALQKSNVNPFSEENLSKFEYNGLKGWDAILGRIGDAMYTGAAGGLVMGAGSSAAGTTIDAVRASQAVQTSRVAERIANVASELPVLKRNPEIFRGFMQDVIARHGGANMVYLPTESARKLFQSAGAEPVLQQMPRLLDDIEKAESAGTDVAIPFADYLTYVAPTGLHEKLQGELRFDPTDLTAKEAENLLAELPKQAKLLDELMTDETQAAAPTDVEARRTAFNAVYGQLAGQRIRGGEITDADAARYASFWLASMEAHASKTKQTLAQVMEQGGIPQFKFDEERVDALSIEDFDAALDQIRGEMTAPPAPAATTEAEATTPAAMTEEEKAASLPSGELADPEAGATSTSPPQADEAGTSPPAVSAEPTTLGSPQRGSHSATPAPAEKSAGAVRSPRARRRARGVEAVRRAVQRQRIDLTKVSNEEARALITQAGKEADTGERRALEQTPLTPQAKRVVRFLTPEQASKRNATVNAIAERLSELDTSANELAAAALAGQAKRGWYRNSQRTLEFVFGPDAARFTALLAATSPQAPVADNLKAALKMWTAWVDAGRPTDVDNVTQIVTSIRNFDGWTKNAVRALTAADPENVELSGLKVESFRRNLRGDFNAVTADAWVAALFSMAGEDITALSPYAAISARYREAARILTEKTGETWTPAEVQETTWSWAKSHVEARKVGGPTVGELSAQGAVTAANLRDVPDFDLLMTQNEAVREIIEGGELGRRAAELGVATAEGPDVPIGEAATAPLGDLGRRALGRLADRLEHVYRARRAVEALRAEDPSLTDRDALRLLRVTLASQRGREAAAARSALGARGPQRDGAAEELPAGAEGDGRQRSDVGRVLAQSTLREERLQRLGLTERDGKVVLPGEDGAEFTEADLLGPETTHAAARALNRALGMTFSEGFRNTLAEMKVYKLGSLGATPEAVDATLRPWLEKIGWSYRIFGPKTGQWGLTFAEKFGDQQPERFRAYYPDFSDPATPQYEQKTVQIYDPSEHEGSFSDTAYTLAWRVPHEIAHGLTNDEMTAKYGAKGNRAGALGAVTKGAFFRTVEKRQLWEAMRAVEWELVTFKKQREIFERDLGVTLTEDEFRKENSINLAGAVYRAVTGQFANPEEAGIMPTSLDPEKMLRDAFDLLALIAEDRGMPLDVIANPDVAPEVETLESEGDRVEEATDSVLAGAPRRILEQSVFHGTGVKKLTGDRFSLDHIGSGEGAQAYGWGLYFTSKRDVAEWYRGKLSRRGRSVSIEGVPVEEWARGKPDRVRAMNALIKAADRETNPASALQDAIEWLERARVPHEIAHGLTNEWLERANRNNRMEAETAAAGILEEVAGIQRSINELTRLDHATITIAESGNVFEVEVPDDAELMNWETTLSEQPEILAKIRAYAESDAAKEKYTGDFLREVLAYLEPDSASGPMSTGESLYQGLVATHAEAPQEVSEFLREAGIPGHHYIGRESDATNYVIYDDSRIAVKRALYQKRGVVGYHGTSEDFEEFDTTHEFGAHFSTNERVAEGFAGSEGRVVAAQLGVENPIELPDLGDWRPERVLEALVRHAGFSQSDVDAMHERAERESRRDDAAYVTSLQEQLIERGYDGIKYENVADQKFGTGTSYIVFRDSQIQRREVEQETRGSIDLTDPQLRNIVVSITSKNADHTTVLHEMAHYWLARLERDAPQFAEIAKDLAGVKKWLGIKSDAAITDAHHEKFARGFEKYLFEGKAPNAEMRSVFAQARAWVIKAYQAITNPYFTSDGKPIELNDDIRTVFDRLIATDQQIEQARRERGLNLKLGALINQGLTSSEAERYEQLLEEAREEQFAKAVGRSMRDLKKQLAEEKRNEKEIRAEAKKSVESRPIVQAREWLARGVWLGEGEAPLPKAKLSTATLTGMFGRAFVAKLPKQIHRKSGATIHPDFVAQQFGFKTAHEMLVQLADSKPVEDLISAEAQARIEQQREEQAPSALAEEVVAAMDSRKQIDVLVFEEKAIAKQNGGRITPNMILRRAAQRVADTTRYREANAHLYRVAAERAGRAALEAVANGDFVEAQKQKSKQRFNLFIESALRHGKEDAEKTIEFARKGEKREAREKLGKAGDTYLQAWDDLLELVDLKPRSNRAVDRLANLRAWVESEREAGRQPLIHRDILEAASLKSYKDMTLGEIEKLGIALRNIKHLADVKTKLMDGQHEQDVEEAETELLDQIEKKPLRKHPMSRDESDEAARRRSNFEWADAALRRTEFLIDEIDEGKLGPWRKLIWRPLKRAEAARNKMQRAYTEKLMKLLDGLMRGHELEFRVRKVYPELGGFVADKSKLLSIALNLGNEGNLKRLLEGSTAISPNGAQWTEQGVMAVLNRELSERDWKFVQEAWDLIDTLWPDIVAQEKRRTGIAPERVEAREVETPYGTMRGGYYPVVYDHRLADFAKANMERDLFENAENGFRRPHTWSGFTESRKEVSGPLMLDLFVLPSHIDKVIHHLTHWEPINNINELLRRKGVRSALKNHLGEGYSYENFWLPWLQSIANDRGVSDPTLANLHSFLNSARNKVSVFTLGFRATTLAVQPLGQLNAMGQLSKKLPNWKRSYAKHARIVARPDLLVKAYKEISEKSEFMRDRVSNMDRDTRDVLREKSLKHGYGDQFARWAMQTIGLVQLGTVDIPIWLTAYNGALTELDMSEEDAIDFADSIVSQSQSAGGAKDLAPIQRSDAVLKQFIMFYGFLSAQWNQLRRAGADVSSVKDVPRFLATFSYALFAPTILAEMVRAAIKGRELPIDDDDDDEWSPWEIASWVLRTTILDTLGGVTGVLPIGEVASTALGARPREVRTPMGRIATEFETAIRDTKKAAEGEGETAVALLDWLRVYGIMKGLPIDDFTAVARKEARD